MKTDRQIELMGIVNLTDDSYFVKSRCADADAALRRVGKMVEDGADIIDIGACSTRPGSLPVGADEEWLRLEPALAAISRTFPDLRISVDTYWSSVVEKVHGLIGDFIVNDISAGEDDPQMLATVGRLGLEYIAMHKRGTSMTMQSLTDYDEVVSEVVRFFKDFCAFPQKCKKAPQRALFTSAVHQMLIFYVRKNIFSRLLSIGRASPLIYAKSSRIGTRTKGISSEGVIFAVLTLVAPRKLVPIRTRIREPTEER